MIKKNLKKQEVQDVLDKLELMHPEASCALNYDNTFQLVLAVSLSAQTTDVSVNKITPELFTKYPTPEDLSKANQNDVEDIIKSIGLYKNKARNIIALSKMLVEKFDSVVPNSIDELITLPGVGRKTANVVLAEGFGQQTIAVDTHVFRVANRIGLCNETDVIKTEQTLMKVIPNNYWTRAHHLLIFHGRKCCSARNPNCMACLISKTCRFYSNK